ncbi:MAG: DUF378 domain-containing protein [Nanoarchaeota archaeon]|nr:DUF378 domain-containing protein [Nanoarchaeota archaeon]
MKNNKLLDDVTMFLTFVGGINWGLIGIGSSFASNWNIVQLLFENIPFVENGVYIAVGISAGYLGWKSIKKFFR